MQISVLMKLHEKCMISIFGQPGHSNTQIYPNHTFSRAIKYIIILIPHTHIYKYTRTKTHTHTHTDRLNYTHRYTQMHTRTHENTHTHTRKNPYTTTES